MNICSLSKEDKSIGPFPYLPSCWLFNSRFLFLACYDCGFFLFHGLLWMKKKKMMMILVATTLLLRVFYYSTFLYFLLHPTVFISLTWVLDPRKLASWVFIWQIFWGLLCLRIYFIAFTFEWHFKFIKFYVIKILDKFGSIKSTFILNFKRFTLWNG